MSPRNRHHSNTSPDTRQAPGRTLLVLGFGTLAFVLAQTTVIPALGDLQRELGASTSGIAWMVTAYLLVASIATPIFGRLGDMFGKQRLLAISLALFAVGSVVAGLADSLPLMIVGRGLQGLGGGVFPLSFGIIRDEFPSTKCRPASHCSEQSPRSAAASACRSAGSWSTRPATTGSSGSPR
jgi:MFS family permease